MTEHKCCNCGDDDDHAVPVSSIGMNCAYCNTNIVGCLLMDADKMEQVGEFLEKNKVVFVCNGCKVRMFGLENDNNV